MRLPVSERACDAGRSRRDRESETGTDRSHGAELRSRDRRRDVASGLESRESRECDVKKSNDKNFNFEFKRVGSARRSVTVHRSSDRYIDARFTRAFQSERSPAPPDSMFGIVLSIRCFGSVVPGVPCGLPSQHPTGQGEGGLERASKRVSVNYKDQRRLFLHFWRLRCACACFG